MTAAASDARRPRVVCHMIASVDGRILTDGWPLSEEGRRQYERVHEVSVLIAPVVDGRMGTPSLFDVDGEDATPYRLALDAVERRADDALWLRYRVETAAASPES